MRHLPRFYALFEPESEEVPLTAEQAHHILHVLRLKSGDSLHIFNAKAGEWSATLDILKHRCVALKQVCVLAAEMRRTQSWLAFSPLKPNLTHFVIEKATELDVTHIQPLIMALTQVQRWPSDKWLRVAEDAAQQCERLDIPEIYQPLSLGDFLAHLPPVQWFTALERSESSVAPQPAGDWGLVIGPEGGFAEDERDILQKRTQPLSLGRNILRAETAAVAGLCVITCAHRLRRQERFTP